MAKGLSQEDTELLQIAMKDVIPLQTPSRVHHPPRGLPARTAHVRQTAAENHPPKVGVALSDAFMEDLAHLNDDTEYRASGLSHHALVRLRREPQLVKASLDLHGYTVDEARTRLYEFVRQCYDMDLRRIRVVHGQGYGSRTGQSILKLHVRHWLQQMHEVMGYVTPDIHHGGGGALLVRLRTPLSAD
ncbi:Smr/MutS family protein [Orrella sp. 11846]|uniref:Smr/MutS family protein n=1 Tax=Orrella sp. 11846 TaxID=3409913 RepID=UPI003B5B8F09